MTTITLTPDQLTVIKILLLEEQLRGDNTKPTPMRPSGSLHDEVVDVLAEIKQQLESI